MQKRLLFALFLAPAAALAFQSPGDWPMYNRDYASTRFSELSQITPKNVANLKQVCSYILPEPAVEFESSLVAVAGTLYFTTFEYTYAVDASNCALKWRVKHQLEQPYGLTGTTRGIALLGNRIFRGFRDGTVIAYNTRDGEQLWTTRLKTPDGVNATIAASPLAWNGIVFIGTSGAEQACQCEIAALDANTGRVLWTFALTPTGNAPGAETWPKGTHVGGGSNWTALSLDADSGALYIPVGNPGPDFAGDYRPGSNLYSGSIVVLDAKTGALRTWYQLVPHDVHDWDQAATPALITTKAGRRRAMAAGKDGFLHSIDTTAGKIAWKTAVTTIENNEAPLTPEGTHFCPGTAGGVSWNGPAYSPATNLVYVNSIDRCTTLKIDPDPPKYEPGKAFLGSADAFGVKDARNLGWLMAVDADSGAVRWRYQAATPMVAGIVATTTGLVMTADLNGDFLAFDAATGSLLHRIPTHQPAGGGVITYQTGAQQRIAIATGLNSGIFETKGQPQVVVFGL
jgi:alcohol dehydrogenase (cytochrome c)